MQRAARLLVGTHDFASFQAGGPDPEDTVRTLHCVEIADGLGLAFCKLSLVAAAGGDCYCFGLDRTPQLYQCAIETQIEIVRALVRALTTVTEPS